MAEEKVILTFDVDLEDSIESIESLTKANKELREERKKLNLNTDDGKKRINEINATLDKNTDKIKNNVSALEKQKINIGNYKSALDGVVPGLGGFAQGLEKGASGFRSMAKAALSFIATPIGAVLAALVAVFSLLKAALSQNDALMDKFENITNAVGVVLEIVVARIGKLGEALIALAQGNFSEAIDLTSKAFSGLGDEIERAVTQQQLFLDASRNLEDSQRNLRIEVAKQTTEITKLIKESKNRNLSLDEQSAKLVEASRLESNLQKVREDIAFRDLVITSRRLRADKEFQQQSSETFEQYINRLLESSKLAPAELDKIADKVVALEEARNSGLVLQQKIENDLTNIELKRADALTKQNEALAKQAELDKQAESSRRIKAKSDKAVQEFDIVGDPEIKAEFQKAGVITNINKNLNDFLVKSNKDAQDKIVKDKEIAAAIEANIEQEKLKAFENVATGIQLVTDQQSTAYKLSATAQALVSTYLTAQKAYEAAFLPIPTVASPALGFAFAAAAVAKGLAQVAAINGVQFDQGGWTGPGSKMQPAGIVHADEYVAPKWVVNSPRAQPHLAALESMRLNPYNDGGLVTRLNSNPINQSFEISNLIKNMPAPIVSVKEINRGQKAVKVKQNISQR